MEGTYRVPNSAYRRGAIATAKMLLHREGNQTALVLAILIALTASFLPAVLIEWPVSFLLDWEAIFASNSTLYTVLILAQDLLVLVFSFFTALPLYIGVYRMAVLMSKGKHPGAMEIFYYFSEGKLYARVLGILFRFAWRILLVYLFVPILMPYILVLDMPGIFQFLCLIALAVFIAFLTLVFVSFSGGNVTFAVVDDAMPLRMCAKRARAMSRGKRGSHLLFSLSWLWRMLLGLASIGTVLFIYTMPLALLANANYVGRCVESNGETL